MVTRVEKNIKVRLVCTITTVCVCVCVLSSQLPVNYLLAWLDVGVDVFEHWFEHGIVAHTQVLDLDLTVPGPVLRHLRGVWGGGRNTF